MIGSQPADFAMAVCADATIVRNTLLRLSTSVANYEHRYSLLLSASHSPGVRVILECLSGAQRLGARVVERDYRAPAGPETVTLHAT